MLRNIKGLLLDIGGVLYVGHEAIAGAPEAVARLRERYAMRFLTNTTRSTPEMILDRLDSFGFALTEAELFTALSATKRYVEERGGRVLTVLTDEASAYFVELFSDTPDFVVVGDAYTNFDFTHMNRAFRALMGGAKLIAAAKNRYFKDEDGELSMDAGGFIAALEYAAHKEATIIGKPSQTFFHLAVSSMGLQPHEVLMVGDDIESDIKGAQEAGLKAALVKTGKYREEDLQKGIKPDLIFEDIVHLSEYLLA